MSVDPDYLKDTSFPKEDFPFDPYMLLEKRLKTLRLYVMREAAAQAGGFGRVERKHLEAALSQLSDHPEIVRSILQPNAPATSSERMPELHSPATMPAVTNVR